MIVDDDDPLLHEDLSRPSISLSARSQQPIFLPCPRSLIQLGTGFDSSLIHDQNGPWKRSIFDFSSPGLSTPILAELGGTYYSLKEATTSSSSNSTDHFSGSLGVSVGCPFLSASVSGEYDRTVSESKQGTQASRNATYRVGRCTLVKPDCVSKPARDHLRDEGAKSFQATYGDYYVAGYVLGVDRGAVFHLDSSNRSERTETAITVVVKVLFWEARHTERTIEEHLTRNLSMSFAGYDSMHTNTQKLSTEQGDGVELIRKNSAYFDLAVRGIVQQVNSHVKDLGLANGRMLSLSECDKLYTGGIVSQIVLLPYKTLKELL